jgi:hypothetical protein
MFHPEFPGELHKKGWFLLDEKNLARIAGRQNGLNLLPGQVIVWELEIFRNIW